MTELERYLDDFGRRLEGAAPARSGRLRIALVGAVAVAAVVVAASLAGNAGKRLDPVAEARAALDPPRDIVYMRVTSRFVAPKFNSVPPPQTTELWSALNPPRWRFVQTLTPPRPGRGGAFDAHGPLTGRQEVSYARGVQRSYLADRDVLTVTRGYSDNGSAARVPLMLGSGSGDLQADLRSMLAEGDVTDQGERRVGARTVRRLVSTQRVALTTKGDPTGFTRVLVYDVDPRTFAPIQATLTLTTPAPGTMRLMTRMRFDAYERIPLTAATAKLLRIRTTPRTKFVVHTAAELRARAARFRKSCHKLKSGVLACKAPGVKPPKVP